MPLHRMLRPALVALALVAPVVAGAQASLNSHSVPSGEGDAIFAVGDGGALIPIAVRAHGTFMNPGSNEGGPPARLRSEANAAILVHGSAVNVVFGRRTVARVAAKIEDGAATIKPPASIPSTDSVEALASPTLTGHATSRRRAPTALERSMLLSAAALAMKVRPNAATVVTAAALDLGRGTAVVGTVTAHDRASGKRRNVFIVQESGGATQRARIVRATLLNVTSVPDTAEMQGVTQEMLIDAIDLDARTPAIVTRISGFDASTYAVYTRTRAGTWAKVYTGGGAAL